MKRGLFNILTVISLLLLVATMGLWVRGGWANDVVRLRTGVGMIDGGLYAQSRRGELVLYHPMAPILSGFRDVTGPPSAWKVTKVDGTPKERWMKNWWPTYRRIPVAWEVTVPHWMLALALLMMLVLGLWGRRAPVKEGFCRTCGYDLRASKDRCPECGTPIITNAEAKA